MRHLTSFLVLALVVSGTLPSRSEAQPFVIAHRGESSRAPENTLAAFRGALEAGADFVEFDVHLSADGVPVVIHDETVDRTTEGSGRVDTLTVAQLKALDAGSWFSAGFAGERIPTLGETLELLRGKGRILLELKDAEHTGAGERGGKRAGQASALVAKSLEVVDRTGVRAQVLFQTFYPANLRELKKQARGIPYAFLYNFPERRHLATAYAKYHRAAGFNPRLQNTRRSQVLMAHLLGMEVFVYTPDEVAEFQQALDLGVDGIITNNPRELGQFLRTRKIPARKAERAETSAVLDARIAREQAQMEAGEPLASEIPTRGPLPWSGVESLRAP